MLRAETQRTCLINPWGWQQMCIYVYTTVSLNCFVMYIFCWWHENKPLLTYLLTYLIGPMLTGPMLLASGRFRSGSGKLCRYPKHLWSRTHYPSKMFSTRGNMNCHQRKKTSRTQHGILEIYESLSSAQIDFKFLYIIVKKWYMYLIRYIQQRQG